MIGFLAPEFLAIHPIAYDAPEEDIFLLDLSFMSQAPEAMMHVPGYSSWLEAQNHAKCYEYMVTLLKILHWQRPGDCWVLKTPHHMEHLDVVLDDLPEVRVLQTHRDPKKSVASFCSMVAHARAMLSDLVDPLEIGAHWSRRNVKNRYGRHVYSLASFGLDDETVNDCCEVYMREYGIPDETAVSRRGA